MKRWFSFIVGSIAATSCLMLPMIVSAQSGSAFGDAQSLTQDVAGAARIETTNSLPVMIGQIINVILGFLGIILLVIFLYAGFLWMTAGGGDQVKTAKAWMINALIGLVIVIASFAISDFVLSQLITKVAGG